MNWPRWRWLEEGVLPVLVAAVRVCWLWPWLELIRRWFTPAIAARPLPLWALPALLLGGLIVSRLALAKTAGLRAARSLVAGIGLAAVVALLWGLYGDAYAGVPGGWLRQLAVALTDWRIGFPPALVTLVIAAGIWLRGVLDGSQRLRRDDVWGAFATGFAALALLLIAAQLDPGGLPPNTDRWLLALVACGLTALALASVDLAHSATRRNEARSDVHLNRDWLVSVILVVGGMLVVGLALGALITPATVGYVLGLVGWLLRWVGVVVGYVLLAVIYVLFLVLDPLIRWLQARMGETEPREGLGTGGLQRTLEELAQQPGVEMPPMAEETLRWLMLAGVGIVLLIVFALALRYLRSGGDEEIDETRDTVFSGELLQDQLAALWAKLRGRLRRPIGSTGSPYLSLEGETDSRAAIRALYQAVLARAAAGGYGRSPGQTPHEYQARLLEMARGAGRAWSTITEVYVAARYGRSAPPAEEVARMQAAWAQAQMTLAEQAAAEEEQ